EARRNARSVTDHDRVAQAICYLSKANRRPAVAIVPNAAVIRPATPANARCRAIWAGNRSARRFTAAAATIVLARDAHAIAERIGQNESIAKAAKVHTWPRANQPGRARGAAGQCSRENRGAAAVVATRSRKPAIGH